MPTHSAADSPYKLPYPAGTAFRVTQGNSGSTSHYGRAQYAFDFDGGFDGKPVVASRSGTVLFLKDDSAEGGCRANFGKKANYVVIDHGDGTSALYLHLQYKSITVKEGQRVQQGQQIALADSTGYVCGAHLHFQVQQTPRDRSHWYTQSIKISFADADVLAQEPDGIPKAGKTYRSSNQAPPTPEPPSPTPRLTPTPTPTLAVIPTPIPAPPTKPPPSDLGSSPRCNNYPAGPLSAQYDWNFSIRVADPSDRYRNIFRKPDFLFHPGELVKLGLINLSAPPEQQWNVFIKVIDPSGGLTESSFFLSFSGPGSSRYVFYPDDFPGAGPIYEGVYTVVFSASPAQIKEAPKEVIFCRGFTVTAR
jgi:hypothetical protein